MGDIFTDVFFPVFDSFDVATRKSVGVARAIVHWADYFENSLPASMHGLVLVLENGCDEPYTYEIDGGEVTPLGHGDLHDKKYGKYMKQASFDSVNKISDGTEEGLTLHFDKCRYSIRLYPSERLHETLTTNTPIVITSSVVIVFLFAVVSAI